MLYYTILYYTILYYTILYYTILYYTILYYTILYYTILYYTILYYTILYYTRNDNLWTSGRRYFVSGLQTTGPQPLDALPEGFKHPNGSYLPTATFMETVHSPACRDTSKTDSRHALPSTLNNDVPGHSP